jgi:hypothetical protein
MQKREKNKITSNKNRYKIAGHSTFSLVCEKCKILNQADNKPVVGVFSFALHQNAIPQTELW